MDEQKKEGFEFKPDLITGAEPEPADIPIEQKYNFDLFTVGKEKKSGVEGKSPSSVDRKPNVAKAAPEARTEKKATFAESKTKTKAEPADVTAAEVRPVADKPQEVKPTEKNTVRTPEPKKELPIDIDVDEPNVQGVKLDDDFQISSGFKSAEIAEPAPMPKPVRKSSAPVGQSKPAESGRNRNNNASERMSRRESEVGNSFVGFCKSNKIKLIVSAVISLIAIIAIVSFISGMRVDIFGITNTGLIMGLLITGVLLVFASIFIKRISRLLNAVVWILIILIFAGCFAGIVLSCACDFLGISRDRNISDFSVPEDGNWGTEKIAQELYDEGIINHPFLFRMYSKIKHYDGTYQWGNYEFNSEMDYGTIMNQLRKGNTAATIEVRIPEAATVDEIIEILEQNKVCTRDQFIEAMDEGEYSYNWANAIPKNEVRYRFEGYLYPDTYRFYQGESVDNAEKAIDKMLNAFNSHLPDNYRELVAKVGERIGKKDMTLHDALAVGSILELEASGNGSEMKNVASVFYNRLTWDEPHYLGSTPTYYYPDNRYNTNAGTNTVKNEDGTEKVYPAGFEGLPPGPQCSITETAIKACLTPSDTDYTYFVTDSDMKFYYNKSYTAHLNTIARLKASGKWAA